MQKNSKKVLSACSVATLLVAGTTLPSTVKADSSSQVTRIGGQNRYETAAKVADSGWSSSNYAIVANGEGYADALCATPLAKAKDAPILLTTGDSLNENALKELNDLKVQHVIVIGGTKVVPENVESEIKSKVSTVQDVQRLGGQDRYETSVKIADALGTNPTKAVVASGEGYADALSAGPAAAINGIPILLTRQNSLPDAESNYLKTNSDITATYVIGGTMSVSDSVASSLPSSERLGGTDRYATNAAVLNKFKSDFNFNNVYAALGDGPVGNEFADALTGGALAAKNKNPLVITGYELSSSTEGFLKDNVPKNSTLTVLGGTLNISDSLADTITDAFGKASTGGGGGGSTETDLTKFVSTTFAGPINNELNKSGLNDNFSLDTSNNELNLIAKYDSNKIGTVEDIFNNVDDAPLGDINTPNTIAYRVNKLNDLAAAHVNALQLKDSSENLKTYQDFLAKIKSDGNSKFAQYIIVDSNGKSNLDVIKVATKISNKTTNYNTGYEQFVKNLYTAIKGTIDVTKTSSPIKVHSDSADTTLNIYKIINESNGKTLYDSSLTRDENIKSILNLDNNDIPSDYVTTGKYKVYVDGGYFYVNVTAQS
ncbi:cell wall-binding repeat-containing protein [uncultured Clostridium sp.]|uniref:cell wall-binding repeat-containing protein n=1 Tax=uncultured Clostridium sp. TaxID=59620 RepID=UPI0025E656F4|nr:cell wall-binding repeat-containing protein [uncultured Clostridium sp.]